MWSLIDMSPVGLVNLIYRSRGVEVVVVFCFCNEVRTTRDNSKDFVKISTNDLLIILQLNDSFLNVKGYIIDMLLFNNLLVNK